METSLRTAQSDQDFLCSTYFAVHVYASRHRGMHGLIYAFYDRICDHHAVHFHMRILQVILTTYFGLCVRVCVCVCMRACVHVRCFCYLNALYLNFKHPCSCCSLFVFAFLAVLNLRYLSMGISSAAIKGKQLI